MNSITKPAIVAALFFVCAGCAHRSGYSTASSAGYTVSYAPITWDYPHFRASVAYRNYEDCVAFSKQMAAQYHRDQATDVPAGGRLLITVDPGLPQNLALTEAIALYNGEVIGRGSFTLENSKFMSTHWEASTYIDLPVAPITGHWIALDIVGPGLSDGPYRFVIERQ